LARILVRKLLRRGNFISTEDLRTQVLDFIAYFNRTLAQPFNGPTWESRCMLDPIQSGLTYAGVY
jgi:putative transposase